MFLGFASAVVAFIATVPRAVFVVRARFYFAVREVADFFAVFFVSREVHNVARAAVVVESLPFAVLFALAERAGVVDAAILIPSGPDALLLTVDIVALVEFASRLVPSGPFARFVAIRVRALAPFFACFVVVGPYARFHAMRVVAADAEIAVGAPVEEPFALLFAGVERATHIQFAQVGPPCGGAVKFVVAVGALKFLFAVVVPFGRFALFHSIDKRDLLLELAVGVPRFIEAMFEAVDDSHLTFEGAVVVPHARGAVRVAFLSAFSAILIELLPSAGFVAVVVVGALLEDLAVVVPPSP